MGNIFLNGGMIGVSMDFNSTEQYIIGSELATLTYVGGQTSNRSGTGGSVTITFSLTGGTNSTPQAEDLVVVLFATGTDTSNRDMNVRHNATGTFANADYSEIADLFALDTDSTNLYVGYSFMGATPATGITLPNGTFSNQDGGAVTIQVWRNVDSVTPLDVDSTTTTITSSGIPDPPSITTVTNNAVIIVCAASGHGSGIESFSSSELSNFLTAYGSDNYDSTVGMGSYLQATVGTFNPAAFTASYADNTDYSAAAVTLALRPASTIQYGNYKNSGIWSFKPLFNSI
jgi:hypothetical protein